MKKIVKKKKPSSISRLENQVAHLTAQVTQLAQIVHAQNIERQQEKFQRPPVENIRVVHQKTAEHKTGNDILDWTTNQVNQHLDSLSDPDLQDIVQSAITGQPIPEKTYANPRSPVQGGTNGKMADWLNTNIPTVNTQENIWSAIENAKVIAQGRNAARAIEAKEFTKEWTAAMKDSKNLQDAYKQANVDTIEI